MEAYESTPARPNRRRVSPSEYSGLDPLVIHALVHTGRLELFNGRILPEDLDAILAENDEMSRHSEVSPVSVLTA